MSTHWETLHQAGELLAAGDRSGAERLYRDLLALSPQDPVCLRVLGVLAFEGGDLDAAEQYFVRGQQADPLGHLFPSLLGRLCRMKGRSAEAVEHYRRAVRLAPDSHELHNDLGAALNQLGALDDAAASFRRSIELQPTFAAHYNLGLILGRSSDWVAVAAEMRRAIELEPNSAEALNNLGVALRRLGQHQESVLTLRRALQLKPHHLTHYNLGKALFALHELPEAEIHFRRAVAMAPQDHEPHNALGNLLHVRGQIEEASACFDAALARKPDSALAQQNRAFLQLLKGDFGNGWQAYECRWQLPGAQRPPRPVPFWNGEPLGDGTLLLFFEQGIGDTIQFIRYAALIKQAHPGATIVLHCPPAWHELLKSVAGIDRLTGGDLYGEDCDYYGPLLSLPRVFQTTLETIPAEVPYLAADPARVECWRRELAGISGLKVGIAWQGNPKYASDYYRSIPLENFAPLAACLGVTLFSLQKNFGHEQMLLHGQRLGIVDLGARLDNGPDAMVDTAAVMKNLDLVITSDTSVAHLAGALGVEVWVALDVAPNWRWMQSRQDSPWYPTMRLFRQSSFHDWPPVFADMAQALGEHAARRAIK